MSGVSPKSKILDFGCGNARLLRYMRSCGFSNLVGYDEYNKEPVNIDGLKIVDRLTEEMTGQFKLVMAHHVLEHLPDPINGLLTLKKFVCKGGVMLIRVPLAQCYAWRHYGINWVQLDAPRHLVLPSEKSMRLMFEATDLELFHIEYDSTDFQFLGSENYARGIAMFDASQPSIWKKNIASYSETERIVFRKRAEELNACHDGDQVCFYVRAKN